jgi:hypothetical protein
LRKGDTVEIVTDRGPNPKLPRAQSVRVLLSMPGPPPARVAARTRPGRLDDLFPRGNLTLSGIVTQISPSGMVIRTRTQGDTKILLRDDTRYFSDGRESGYAELKVNARVFVRAGRDLDQSLEAYQVMWGEILRPKGAERTGASPSAP